MRCDASADHLLEDPLLRVVGVLNDTLREPANTRKESVSVSAQRITDDTNSWISFSAFSTESEPWQMLRPTARAKSPRMVPERANILNICDMGFSPAELTRLRGQGVGGTQHDTTCLDGIKALPDHRNDGSRSHVLDQARKEGLVLEISVVCTTLQTKPSLSVR